MVIISFSAISLQWIATRTGKYHGFAVVAMVVTCFPPGGRRGWVLSPFVLPSVAVDVASICAGVPHGNADGSHGCGLLSDARRVVAMVVVASSCRLLGSSVGSLSGLFGV